ncbi:hypothetical protein F2Q68_00011904 [Brassica cretica]|uniref:Uncharacterized protein n=1 Tax=Brassica cretica TaxID=69181 RepID=A0A8S9L402_BRACR|nr:hypothetical protein F2Q68_00011904 [Brassica cretica]
MRSSEYSDEFPRNIPMKYRGNHIPRKTPMNIRGYIIAIREPLGDFKNSEEIPRKEPLPSGFRRNFLGVWRFSKIRVFMEIQRAHASHDSRSEVRPVAGPFRTFLNLTSAVAKS